jgi:VanZ family protein
MLKKLLNYWLPVGIWALVIFKLSAGTVPQFSSMFWPNFAFMKSAHALFFGILAILVYRALRGYGMSRKKAIFWAIAATMFYGATDEFHQFFTQGREARLRDIGFDTIGGTLGVLIWQKF